ncbi:MAG: sigma-54 dependent transcriptional regulator [Planctomycetia bacterium]|nr:sigma-54 dependent transcriptional regulator [Planctomycetia bacterium]
MPQLLLVDDDPDLIRKQVEHAFRGEGVTVAVARTGREGLEQAKTLSPSVILLDVRLPDLTGLEVYSQLRAFDRRTPVVFITSTTNTDTAIEAMKLGAYDYLFKPLDLQQLRRIVGQALEVSRLMLKPAVLTEVPPEDDRGDVIVGLCPAMREVYKAIGRVAAQNVIVLITGESGTGKELVARAIYQHSHRADGPFLAINCAAIPENLLESELFGHEKGAFTGADRKRIGKFEQCTGGTLFLDEIGDMPQITQGKVLRLLQDQTFERVGGNETIKTDVRIIAATNRPLLQMAERGEFRSDLFYRLGVFNIHLPPLRDRGEDLPHLVRHYLRRFNRELTRDVREVPSETAELLARHPWPGNIRELQSVLKQSLLRATGHVLLPTFLPESFTRPSPIPEPASDGRWPLAQFVRGLLEAGGNNIYDAIHRELDRLVLPMILEHTEGNQLRAAELLGIARKTLRMRLRELDLKVSRTVEPDEGE